MSALPPVRPGDRVSDVLARDIALVEVFARHSAHFARLRNPAMRRVMARLVTVEQAARVCGAPVDLLVRDLNLALGVVPDAGATPAPGTAGAGDAGTAADRGTAADAADGDASPGAPSPLADEPGAGARVIELDVRPDLREGREPFARIMSAVASLPEDAVLRLRAPFEPAPLYAVMAKRGFTHRTRRDGADDWSVWFQRERGAAEPVAAEPAPAGAALPEPPESTPAPAPAGAGAPASAAANEIVLDVRGMEPPEPMVRTLAALEHLPDGAVLLQINARVPQFLLPLLTERGFAYELDVTRPEEVKVRIRRIQ